VVPKVVLVTGGSRGIGAATCRLAARDGFDVAVSYTARPDAAEHVAAEVRAAGRRAITVRAHIADAAEVEAMLDRVTAELGGLDALVSNAGVIHAAAPLADIPVAEIERILRVDLLGHLVCNAAAVRRMARSRGGRGGVIVNVSSMASELLGAGGFIPYAAAKGGIDVLTRGLGREVAGDGIRVNGVRPGMIDTDIQDDTGIPGRMAKVAPSIPIGRGGTAEEVAEAIVWLLSDRASYVAGAILNVSGAR
jgi:NAD(P)-dependent dehydrogenase (short-subunit alcohol dehydrogenase family)